MVGRCCIALRAVRKTILQEQVEGPSTGVLSLEVKMSGIFGLAPHVIATTRDQGDGRELWQAEEQKFLEVTERLADVAVDALT